MSSGVDTQTHTRILTCELKQFQETSHTWPKIFTFYKATYYVKYSQHEKHAYYRGGMLQENFEN